MLCLPVGFGKTTCALYLACRLQKKTLVVVHKQFLATQWQERIRTCVPSASVSVVQGGACDTSGDFVIAMLQTLISRQYDASTFAECGLVIVDEVHHVAAEVFGQAVMNLQARRTLGLTATPERKDRLGRVVEWFMGPVAYRVKREHQSDTTVTSLSYSQPRYATAAPTNKRGDVCYSSILSILAEDEERTRVVVAQAASLAREGRHVLVLSHRRAHCQRVCEQLQSAGVDAATYMGGDKDVPTAQVLVATYALTSEGFDCPRLTALVLATPSSNVEQAVGRVMRGSATSSVAIVDIVDRWGVCIAQYAKRRAFYGTCGFRVVSSHDPPAPLTVPARLAGFAFL